MKMEFEVGQKIWVRQVRMDSLTLFWVRSIGRKFVSIAPSPLGENGSYFDPQTMRAFRKNKALLGDVFVSEADFEEQVEKESRRAESHSEWQSLRIRMGQSYPDPMPSADDIRKARAMLFGDAK